MSKREIKSITITLPGGEVVELEGNIMSECFDGLILDRYSFTLDDPKCYHLSSYSGKCYNHLSCIRQIDNGSIKPLCKNETL